MCNWSEAIFEKAIEEGLKQGIEQGIEQTNRLIKKLLEANRIEDLHRITNDRPYRENLLKEFGIE